MRGAFMKRYPDIELTENERNRLRQLIVECIIQANLNGIATVMQTYNGPLPVMPSTCGTWLNSGQPMLTSAVRSHLQFTASLGGPGGDRLVPAMAVITNLIPNGVDVLRSDDEEESAVNYNTCLLHLFTELLHELAHAATSGRVKTWNENTIAHNAEDSETQANQWEYDMYEKLLDEKLRKKVIHHRLFCHIFRDGPEEKYNGTIDKLLEMHFKKPEMSEETEHESIQDTE
jgi:hypothetical protein